MRRSSILERAALLACVVVAHAACDRGSSAPSPAPPASATAAPREEAYPSIRSFARDSAALAVAAASRPPPASDASGRVAYLWLRWQIAAGTPFWTRGAKMGAEALLGPPLADEGGGGALGELDAAMASGDAEAIARAWAEVARALSLIQAEMSRGDMTIEVASRALSAAAYDLGARAIESTTGAPAEADAVLADLQGTLQAIDGGASALASSCTTPDRAGLAVLVQSAEALRARVAAADPARGLVDRASFVVETGALGVRVRDLARACGVRVLPPYPPRVPVSDDAAREPVSALTLPAPRIGEGGDDALADLGARLFFDRRLSRGQARSCASCHDPARGWADGLARPTSLVPHGPALRHTPTLLYTSLHAAQMWDGRTLTPSQQALGVLHAPAEMGITREEIAAVVAAIPAYRDRGVTDADAVARALVAFEVRYLVPADAPIDRFARGDAGALGADDRAGFDVFTGRGRCARCHAPPFFGGSRPADFASPIFAALGTPDRPRGRKLDADRGRALVTGLAADEGAFKTPTVRDVALTAPYFHHGAFPRLEDVVDFYDTGGGRGLGLDVPAQDPDVRPLKLTAEEKRVLLLFQRRALLDARRPARLP